MRGVRLPRRLHAGAWWTWAIGLGAAASMTTNPLLLGLVIAVAALVVAARRPHDDWARGFGLYLALAAIVVAIRVLFRVLLGGDSGGTVLLSVPEIPLPSWAVGVSIGGPVTLEAVVAAAYDGLRLAAVIVCVGAANSLADPRRLLSSVPRALVDVGTAAAVAFSLAPQLVESIERVRKARRLRGGDEPRRRPLRSLLVPVLQDTLDRSLSLAASMGARGYGRVADPSARTTTGLLVLGGLGAVCVGLFALLGGTGPVWVGGGLTVLGLLLGWAGVSSGGRSVDRTRYRPDPWRRQEWLVAASGIAAAVGVWAAGLLQPGVLSPSVQPLVLPGFSVVATLSIVAASTPAWSSPPVRLPAVSTRREEVAT